MAKQSNDSKKAPTKPATGGKGATTAPKGDSTKGGAKTGDKKSGDKKGGKK
ncbi:MAG: hypothetical protein WA952_09720 [Lewinella sp.]